MFYNRNLDGVDVEVRFMVIRRSYKVFLRLSEASKGRCYCKCTAFHRVS